MPLGSSANSAAVAPRSPRGSTARHGEPHAVPKGETKHVFDPRTDPFHQLSSELGSLRTLWQEDAVLQQTRAARLAPLLGMIRDLIDEHLCERELQAQMRLIELKQATVCQSCALLQVDVDQYLPGNLSELPPEEIGAALEQTHVVLMVLLKQRKGQITTLLAQRQRIVNETGDQPKSVVERNAGEPMFRADGSFFLEGKFHPPTAASIRLLEEDIASLQEVCSNRKKTIVLLCEEIATHLVNENIKRIPIDGRVLDFLRTKEHKILGLSIARIEQLTRRKEQLVQEEEKLQLFMEDVRKRLMLIEDRQALLHVIGNVEAAAVAPQRLFGDSTKLVKEMEFRQQSYIRLLGLERVLYQALVDWHRSHGNRFIYKGVDYLEALEEDLKTRRIPHIFPRPSDMTAKCTDFTYVVQQVCTAHPAAEAESTGWTNPQPNDAEESVREKERRVLLKNGWFPPESEEAVALAGVHSRTARSHAKAPAHPKPMGFSEDAGEKDVRVTTSIRRYNPPAVPLVREACQKGHSEGKGCDFPLMQEHIGAACASLPPRPPCVFKTDPHLLLPTPPRIRADHVRLRRHQIDRMRAARHKCECKLDHAVALQKERAKSPIPYKPRRAVSAKGGPERRRPAADSAGQKRLLKSPKTKQLLMLQAAPSE